MGIMQTLRRAAVAAFLMAATAARAAADPPPQYSPDDVVKAYSGAPAAQCSPGTVADPEGGCAPVVRTRGFTLATPGQTSDKSRSARPIYKASAPLSPHVKPGDLLINFKLGSAELTPQARANARAFAAALAKPELSQTRFAIGGHTDASGAPARNVTLSEARAQAVKSFLVAQGVDAARLEAKGYGSERLADPGHPYAAGNRRVEGLRLN
jgi:outer membrane protein OmpA-like peptidoglycan-associated protein